MERYIFSGPCVWAGVMETCSGDIAQPVRYIRPKSGPETRTILGTRRQGPGQSGQSGRLGCSHGALKKGYFNWMIPKASAVYQEDMTSVSRSLLCIFTV